MSRCPNNSASGSKRMLTSCKSSFGLALGVEKGVVKNLFYDRFWAQRKRKKRL